VEDCRRPEERNGGAISGDSLRHQWRINFAKVLAVGLAITLAATLAVYGIVRAMGWVIGGFAAS